MFNDFPAIWLFTLTHHGTSYVSRTCRRKQDGISKIQNETKLIFDSFLRWQAVLLYAILVCQLRTTSVLQSYVTQLIRSIQAQFACCITFRITLTKTISQRMATTCAAITAARCIDVVGETVSNVRQRFGR